MKKPSILKVRKIPDVIARGVKLVISDAHEGIKAAIAKTGSERSNGHGIRGDRVT